MTIDRSQDDRATRPPDAPRRLAAGLYRRARVTMGLTQAEAAHKGGCGERSQRDRELGDCSLGALESLVAQVQSRGLRLVVSAVAAGDEAPPPSSPPPVGGVVVRFPSESALPLRRAS